MDENEKVMKNQEKTAQVQETNNATVIKTDVDAKDGQNKCPKCGATLPEGAKFCFECGERL